MRTYQEKCNSLKARATQELSRLIRKYGVENECETDEEYILGIHRDGQTQLCGN